MKMQDIINDEYAVYGVRRDSKKYSVGDTLQNSHQLYQDPQYTDSACTELLYPFIADGPYKGFYDGGELNGTCAIYADDKCIEQAIDTVKTYDGRYMYLIAGNDYSQGNDQNEIIVKNAKVLMAVEVE